MRDAQHATARTSDIRYAKSHAVSPCSVQPPFIIYRYNKPFYPNGRTTIAITPRHIGNITYRPSSTDASQSDTVGRNTCILIIGTALAGVIITAIAFNAWMATTEIATTETESLIIPDTANDVAATDVDKTTYYPASASLVVPYIAQQPDLPTGCEITSAAMLLSYYVIDVQLADLAGYLNTSDDFHYDEDIATSDNSGNRRDESVSAPEFPFDTDESSDIATDEPAEQPLKDRGSWHDDIFDENPFANMIGPDPDFVFIGDPSSDEGLYCNPQPIADAVNAYATIHGDPVKAQTLIGNSPAQIYRYVARGYPVVIWVTLYMEDYPNDLSWVTESGKHICTTSIDHAMVLTGYDTDAGLMYVNDPIDDTSTEYTLAEFETSYALRGNLALVVIPT